MNYSDHFGGNKTPSRTSNQVRQPINTANPMGVSSFGRPPEAVARTYAPTNLSRPTGAQLLGQNTQGAFGTGSMTPTNLSRPIGPTGGAFGARPGTLPMQTQAPLPPVDSPWRPPTWQATPEQVEREWRKYQSQFRPPGSPVNLGPGSFPGQPGYSGQRKDFDQWYRDWSAQQEQQWNNQQWGNQQGNNRLLVGGNNHPLRIRERERQNREREEKYERDRRRRLQQEQERQAAREQKQQDARLAWEIYNSGRQEQVPFGKWLPYSGYQDAFV